MRVIKFRGLNEYGHFVYGFLTTNGNFDSVIEDYVEFGPTQSDPCGGVGLDLTIVKPETVGQYTGFKDKNGVEIYEGDVISGLTVTYVGDTNGSLGMNAGWYLQRDDFESFVELECRLDHEVVGNIHTEEAVK